MVLSVVLWEVLDFVAGGGGGGGGGATTSDIKMLLLLLLLDCGCRCGCHGLVVCIAQCCTACNTINSIGY